MKIPPNEIRKRRTRGHVIADLSINFVERVCLRAGYSVVRMSPDYGIDLLVTTHDRYGYVEEGWIPIQVKATDQLNLVSEGHEISLAVDRRDLNLWLKQRYPLMLVVFDAKSERTYWLNVRDYVKSLDRQIKDYLNLRLPTKDELTIPVIRKFAKLKAIIGPSD